jgi:hypothetical protein
MERVEYIKYSGRPNFGVKDRWRVKVICGGGLGEGKSGRVK